MKQIRFSHNWNGKLDNRYFTTIRKADEKKYTYYNNAVGENFYVYLKSDVYCEAGLLDVRDMAYCDLPYSTLLIDTGIEDREKIDNLFKKFKINSTDRVLLLTFNRKTEELPF